MKHFYLFLIIFLSSSLHAQESANGLSIVCKHGEIKHSIPSATIPSKLKISQTPTATFVPTYINVPENAIIEIQKALDIWSIILISKTAIRIDISWEQLESTILATTGTPKVYKNFKNAPFKEVWYPPALANALNGERLGSAKEADITLRINSKIDWNLSTLGLGSPGLGGFDMTTVILHEVAHGLGFIASFEENQTGKAQWGIQNLPLIYDTFLTDESNNKLTNNRFYNNNSEKLLQAVTSNKVFFAIDSGSYSPNLLQMHTVTPYRTGASLSHISNRLPLEDPNDGLMFSALTYRNKYSFPGNGTLAILFQMGWALNFYEFEREYPESDVPKVSIYPNPSQNIITLETKNITATQYSIVDFQGREIKRGTIAPLKTEISINDLSTGKYILKAGPVSSVFLKL